MYKRKILTKANLQTFMSSSFRCVLYYMIDSVRIRVTRNWTPVFIHSWNLTFVNSLIFIYILRLVTMSNFNDMTPYFSNEIFFFFDNTQEHMSSFNGWMDAELLYCFGWMRVSFLLSYDFSTVDIITDKSKAKGHIKEFGRIWFDW